MILLRGKVEVVRAQTEVYATKKRKVALATYSKGKKKQIPTANGAVGMTVLQRVEVHAPKGGPTRSLGDTRDKRQIERAQAEA